MPHNGPGIPQGLPAVEELEDLSIVIQDSAHIPAARLPLGCSWAMPLPKWPQHMLRDRVGERKRGRVLATSGTLGQETYLGHGVLTYYCVNLFNS